MKADPGKAGVDNLQAEIEKLRRIRAIGVGTEPFANVPWKVLQMLKRRAAKETASEMRDHFQCHSLRTDGVLSLCASYGGNGRHHAHGD